MRKLKITSLVLLVLAFSLRHPLVGKALSAVKYTIDSSDVISNITSTGVFTIGTSAIDSFLRLYPRSSAPSTVKGAMYMDDSANVIKFFNGTEWKVMQEAAAAECPSGFTDTGYGYCVQDNEANSGNALNWYAASDYCADNHTAVLCTSSEWYNACVNGKLTAGTDDYEWVDSWDSSTYALVRGSGSCDAVTSHLAKTYTYAFRCCKSLY